MSLALQKNLSKYKYYKWNKCGEVFEKDEAVFFVFFCNKLCDELFCV